MHLPLNLPHHKQCEQTGGLCFHSFKVQHESQCVFKNQKCVHSYGGVSLTITAVPEALWTKRGQGLSAAMDMM